VAAARSAPNRQQAEQQRSGIILCAHSSPQHQMLQRVSPASAVRRCRSMSCAKQAGSADHQDDCAPEGGCPAYGAVSRRGRSQQKVVVDAERTRRVDLRKQPRELDKCLGGMTDFESRRMDANCRRSGFAMRYPVANSW